MLLKIIISFHILIKIIKIMEGLDYENETTQELAGGIKINNGFIDHMISLSSIEKAQIMNSLQYGGLAVIPLLVLLKLMKMYVPEEDPLKGTPELLIEVLLQLGFILVAFFFIHKFVLYFPTYSNVSYDKMNLLSVVLPVFFLMFALDTNVSAKLNELMDRALVFLGIKKENFNNIAQKKEGMQGYENTSKTMSSEQYNQLNNEASRLIDGFPTKREPQAQQHVQQPVQEPMMMMPSEPMAANESSFGSLF